MNMKFFVVFLALALSGCGVARDFGALMYCVIHDNDINRKCQ